jgi:hypothetical protein
VKTVLRSSEYGGDEDGAWVLLEPVEPAAGPVLEVPPESAGGSGDS